MAFAPDHAIGLLKAAHENNRLAHALLISGPDMADLQHVAINLAAFVNNWSGIDSLDGVRQRGGIVLEPESKLRRIRIDPVRDMIRQVQFSAGEQGRKIIILSEADRMTVEAVNAFLKTLEEPPADTLIFLLSRAPEQLLDTVRSRCLQLTLFRPQAGGMELTTPQETLVGVLAAYFAAGKPNPTRAMGLLSEFQAIMGEMREQIEQEHKESLKEETERYGRSTDGAWLRERKDYYDNLTECACAEHRNGLVGILFTWLGELLRCRHGVQPPDLPAQAELTAQVASNFADDELHRRLKAVEEMRRNLATNVREILALEVGFLEAFG